MYVPPVVVLDYETALLDGTPSVDYFREDFRVISAAAAWRRVPPVGRLNQGGVP
jgi:hypothetical protein